MSNLVRPGASFRGRRVMLLAVSWFMINFVHGYAVWINWPNPFSTISENASQTNVSLLLYRIAHGVNGLLLIVISNQITILYDNQLVLLLVIFSVFFEWAQAIVPYRNNLKRMHNVFALSMAVSMVALGWSLLISSKVSGFEYNLAIVAGLVATGNMLYYKNPPRANSWILQVVTINALYFQLAAIIIGGRV